MFLTAQKEEFSNAYLAAVACVAGFRLSKPNVDDDSIDWTVAARGPVGTLRSPKVDVQLKCTSTFSGEGDMSFAVPVKNYNDLVPTDFQTPRILVVLSLPSDDVDDWLTQSHDEMVMKKCAYWLSLYGRPTSDNAESVTVQIPRGQIFDVPAMKDIMDRVGAGQPL